MENNDILKVDNLSVAYKDKKVLDNISFSLKAGEILGIVGESGSGKTTLVKAILGLVPVSGGTVRHFSKMPQMIFQDPASSLNPAMKIGKILEEPILAQGVKDSKVRRERAIEALALAGLSNEYYERRPHQLSGGQRQRAAIAAALISNPGLIIADEPLSALDVTVSARIIGVIKDINKRLGISFIFISHDLGVVNELCDRVIKMTSP